MVQGGGRGSFGFFFVLCVLLRRQAGSGSSAMSYPEAGESVADLSYTTSTIVLEGREAEKFENVQLVFFSPPQPDFFYGYLLISAEAGEGGIKTTSEPRPLACSLTLVHAVARKHFPEWSESG